MPLQAPLDATAVHAAALRHVESAVAALDATREPAAERVHEARKSIKRARGVLRLLRPALAPDAFDGLNLRLRDAGRALSATRDAQVLATTLDDALRRGKVRPGAAAELRRQLLPRGGTRARAARPDGVATARRRLAAARRGLATAVLVANGSAPLREGLQRIYRRARRARDAALQETSSESLHEWRKQVKSEWHALEVLAPRRSKRIARRLRDLRELAAVLGGEHDLAVLAARIATLPDAAPGRERLEAAVRARRLRLRDRAFARGAPLYAIAPGAWAAGITEDWPAGRAPGR